MGELRLHEEALGRPRRHTDADWLRQWAVQSAAAVPLGFLTMLVFVGSSADGPEPVGAIGMLGRTAVPLLVWAVAMGGLTFLLRTRSAAVRSGWSAVGGTLLAILLPMFGGNLLPLLAALLASCQVGWASVARELPMARRVGFALGGVAAALAGAAAALMGFTAVVRSDEAWGVEVHAVLSAVIVIVLIAAIVLSFLAGRKGWATLAIVGLVISALSVSIAAPGRGSDHGVRGGFDPASVPDDYAECSFDASRPGCGG